MGRFTGILGLLTMLGFAYVFSTKRRAIRLKTIAWGLGLQFVFAVFVLRIDAGRIVFQKAGDVVTRLLGYAYAGSHFVFGDLAKPGSQLGYFAFGVLPTVIFIAAYFAFGIDPKHLLSAVIMTAPGTLLMAKMLVPETEEARTAGRVVMSAEEEKTEKEENLLGEIARGQTDGLQLALNIAP